MDTKYPRPKTLPDEVPSVLSIHAGKVDRALALDKAHHLGNRVLRRDRNHHMDVVGHQMPFLDPALFLFGQSAEHLPEVAAQLRIQRLATAFGNEHDVVFALPFAVI